MARLLRVLVCALVICSILVISSPIQAQATGLETAAIVSAFTVNVPATICIIATLITIGVVAGSDSQALQDLAWNVENAFADAGTWVKNGFVEMIRTVDEAGNAMYYAAGDFLEAVRSWCFDSGVVTNDVNPVSFAAGELCGSYYYSHTVCVLNFYSFVYAPDGRVALRKGELTYCPTPDISVTYGTSSSNLSRSLPMIAYGDHSYSASYSSSTTGYGAPSKVNEWHSELSSTHVFLPGYESADDVFSYIFSGVFSSDYDVSLGVVPTVPIDGTSAREWAPDYAQKGLDVTFAPFGVWEPDPGDQNNNNNKWFLPLSLAALTALLAMTQSDQWEGVTPPTFTDYETLEDYDVILDPDTGAITLRPVQSGTDSGDGTGPNPGTDPGTSSGSWQPPADYKQFQLVDLQHFFPFCIPFDLFDFFAVLNAEPVAPVFHWEIQDLSGNVYSVDIDLSKWDPLARTFRLLQLFLFVTGLAAASRKFIKW